MGRPPLGLGIAFALLVGASAVSPAGPREASGRKPLARSDAGPVPRGEGGQATVTTAALNIDAEGNFLQSTLANGDQEAAKDATGAIVLLVNSSDRSTMRQLEWTLGNSLIKQLHFRSPVVVLYAGPQGPVELATVKLILNKHITVQLVDVTERLQSIGSKHDSAALPRQAAAPWHRLAHQFWAAEVPFLPELEGYQYLWRLEPGYMLAMPLEVDLYQVMAASNALVGYRTMRNDRPDLCRGLADAVTQFYKTGLQSTEPKDLTARSFFEMYERAGCPRWSPEFLLLDAHYLRMSREYRLLAKHLSDINGFVEQGWDDCSLLTFFAATWGHHSRLLCLTPWASADVDALMQLNLTGGVFTDSPADGRHAREPGHGGVVDLFRRAVLESLSNDKPAGSLLTAEASGNATGIGPNASSVEAARLRHAAVAGLWVRLASMGMLLLLATGSCGAWAMRSHEELQEKFVSLLQRLGSRKK